MFMTIQIITSLVLIAVTYFVYSLWVASNARRKYKWMPAAPRIPILGSVLEFGSNAETLNDLIRLTNNSSKLSYVELVGTRFIFVKDYDLMAFIMSSTEILERSREYEFFVCWLGKGLLTAPVQKWKKRRRVITPAFHFSILEQFVDVFESNGKILIHRLYEEAVDKESVDIYKYITACALDIISESAMGVNVNTLENKNQDYVSAVKEICKISSRRLFSPWKRFDILYRFSSEYSIRQKKLKILHDFTGFVIQERINELKNKKTKENEIKDDLGRKRKLAFLDLLLNCKIDGQPLSHKDIREEVDTFMFAGHDTISSALSSTLFLLAKNQEAQKQAREEQKKIYGKNRDAPTSYQDLQDMKYLEMVIKEALRLIPPVPIVGRKLHEDIEYKGHIIPKDTVITLFIYGINRDPDYHESPDEFKPERFLDSGKYPYSYVPFSAGPRNCIGQKFAILEMKSVISKILRYFELYPTNPPQKCKLVHEGVLKSENGVNIMLKKHIWLE